MLNVEKWPNITARFLKYGWPFFSIMHERIKVHMLEWNMISIFFKLVPLLGKMSEIFVLDVVTKNPPKEISSQFTKNY